MSNSRVVHIDAATLASVLSPAVAIAALEAAFGDGSATAPLRQHYQLPGGGELLLMPAWDRDGMGVKGVQLAADGGVLGGWYVLADHDGKALALIDAGALTGVRTAAVTALATRLLAPANASRLLVFGAGAQARAHIRALVADRPISEVIVVSRSEQSAARLIAELPSDWGIPTRVGHPGDVHAAEIICTCTTAGEPLFDGELIAPGTHVNAVGAHLPTKRELDPTTVARSVVVVETREAAFAEAGDLLLAEAEGRWRRELVAGELRDVLAGRAGRRSPDDITLFKSVGHASEDLAAARAAFARIR